MAKTVNPDITKTGPLTFRELYKLNNPDAPEPDQEVINEMARQFIKTNTAITSPRKNWEEIHNTLVSQYRDPKEWLEELNKVGYGESKFDSRLMPSDVNLEDLQENRALSQSTGEKLLNGVLKGAITSGTTFVNTLAGMPFGLVEAAVQGDVSKIWDNEITNAMSGIEEWSEKALPNYYSKAELESPWYTQVFTANFLGDKLIKNFGFTIGAGAAGTMVLSRIPKLLPKVLTKAAVAAGRSEKDVAAIGRAANSLSTSFLSAAGEGSIEALNATKEWSKEMTNDINQQYTEEVQAIQERYRQAVADLEEDFLNNPPTLVRDAEGNIYNPAAEERQKMMQALEQSMIRDMQKAETNKNQRMAQVASQRAQTGNAVLAFNLPILTMGNLLTLGKVYAKGYTAEMSSIGEHIKFHPDDLANAGKTVKETKRRLTWRGLRDVEKDVTKQAFTSDISLGKNVAKTAGSAAWEGTEEMLQGWASNASKDYNTDYYNQSVDPEYTDKTASMWKSLGDSFVETFGNIDNWEEFAIGMLSGGISNMILGQTREMSRERKAVNEAVAKLNDAVNTFNNREMIKGINRHQYLEDLKTSAAIEHREKAYKDADFAQLASDVVLFGSLGKLDELKAIVDYNLDNLSDAELQQLSDDLSQKEVNGPENNYFTKLDLAGKRKYLKDQQKKYHKVIDDYNNEYNELTSLTGGTFSQEQMSELVYERLRTKNSSQRADEVKQQLKEQIDQALQQQTSDQDYHNRRLDLHQNIISGMKNQLTKWSKELAVLKKQEAELSAKISSTREHARQRKEGIKRDLEASYENLFASDIANQQFQEENRKSTTHKSRRQQQLEASQKRIVQLEKQIEKYLKILNEYEAGTGSNQRTRLDALGRVWQEQRANEKKTGNLKGRLKEEQAQIKLLQKLLHLDHVNIEGYNSALEFISKNLDTIFDVNSKKLYAGNVREAAMATLGLGMILSSISTDTVTSNKLMQGVTDITTLLADAMNYNNRVSEFLQNPQKLEEKNKGIRERVEAKRVERQANKVIDDLANTTDFNEFVRKLNTLDPKVKARVLEKLKEQQNKNALEYESKSKKINLVYDFINRANVEPNIKQTALTIFNEASRLLPEESLFNIDARVYSREANQQLDDETYVKTKTLLAQAFKFQDKETSEPIQNDTINAGGAPTTTEKKEAEAKQASNDVNEIFAQNDDDLAATLQIMRESTRNQNTEGVGNEAPLNLSGITPEQNNSAIPPFEKEENPTPVPTVTVPANEPNNLTSDKVEVDTTVKPTPSAPAPVSSNKNEAVMGMQEYDTKAGSANRGNRPIDEKDANGNLTPQAKNSTPLYNKLKELGAFDNVDNGVVKLGSKVYFGLLPALDQQIEAETGTRSTTILMFVDGKCVGHLPNFSADSIGKQLGIEGLLREEFKKQLDSNPNTNELLISKRYYSVVDELWTGSVFYNEQKYEPLTNASLQWVKDRINSSTTSEEDRTPLITIFDGQTTFKKGNVTYTYGDAVATVYMGNPLYNGAPVILVPSGAYDRNKPNTQQDKKAYVPVALRRTLFKDLKENTTTYKDILTTINSLFSGELTVDQLNKTIGNLKKNLTYEFNTDQGKQQIFISPAMSVRRDDGTYAVVEMTPQNFANRKTPYNNAHVTYLKIQRKVGGQLVSSYVMPIALGNEMLSEKLSPELQKQVVDNLLTFLTGEAGAYVNIDQSRLNDPKYVQQIIDDELLQTNARELRTVANSFHMAKEVRKDDGTQQPPAVQSTQPAQPTQTGQTGQTTNTTPDISKDLIDYLTGTQDQKEKIFRRYSDYMGRMVDLEDYAASLLLQLNPNLIYKEVQQGQGAAFGSVALKIIEDANGLEYGVPTNVLQQAMYDNERYLNILSLENKDTVLDALQNLINSSEQPTTEQQTSTTPPSALEAFLGNNFDPTQQADTEGNEDNSQYSRVTEETKTGTIDIDKEVNNIMRMLPQLDKETAFQIVNDFIKINDQGDNAQGMFNRGIITLSRLAESGTAYHEAFHLVFNMLLTEDEKLALMNEYKDNYPNHSDVDLEEQMADDFKDYVLLKENNRPTSFFDRLGKKVLEAFNRILNFLHLKKHNPTVFQTVASNIWQGKYASRQPSSTTSTRYAQEEYTPEMQQIKNQAIADGRIKLKSDGTFDYALAPNGKRSNLNERQWLHVRTKAFKEWFGDWETVAPKSDAGEKLIKELNRIKSSNGQYAKLASMILDNNALPYSLKYFKIDNNRDDIEGAAAQWHSLANLIEVLGNGVSQESIDKHLLHEIIHYNTEALLEDYKKGNLNNLTKEQINNIKTLYDIISYAKEYLKKDIPINKEKYLEIARRQNRDLDSRLFYAFDNQGDVEIDEFISEIFTNPALQEVLNNIQYRETKQTLWDKIKECIQNVFGITINKGSVLEEALKASTEFITKAKKEYDSVSKVVDENGEPLVVYHSHDGNKFDSSRNANWFSTKRQNYYGNTQYDVFLNIRNLFKKDNPTLKERAFVTEYGTGNEFDKLPTEYDGAMVYHKTFGYYELLTKAPNQIKSATDNVGTYSTEDNDIRYSLPLATRIANAGLTRKEYNELKKVVDDINARYKRQKKPNGFAIQFSTRNGETAFFLTYNSGVVWENGEKIAVYHPEISEEFVKKYLNDNHLGSKFEVVETGRGDFKLVATHELDKIGNETPRETYQRLSAWIRRGYTLTPEERYFMQTYNNKFNTEEVCG